MSSTASPATALWHKFPQFTALGFSLLLHLLLLLPLLLQAPSTSQSQPSPAPLAQQSLKLVSFPSPSGTKKPSFTSDTNTHPPLTSPTLLPSWIRPRAPAFSLPQIKPHLPHKPSTAALSFRYPQLNPKRIATSSQSLALPPLSSFPTQANQAKLTERIAEQSPLQLFWSSNLQGWALPNNSSELANPFPDQENLKQQLPLRIPVLLNAQGQIKTSILPTKLGKEERQALSAWLSKIQLKAKASENNSPQIQSGTLSISE